MTTPNPQGFAPGPGIPLGSAAGLPSGTPGLPSAGDVAAWASAYFPEFAAESEGHGSPPSFAVPAAAVQGTGAALVPSVPALQVGAGLSTWDFLRVLDDSLEIGAVLANPLDGSGQTAVAAEQIGAGSGAYSAVQVGLGDIPGGIVQSAAAQAAGNDAAAPAYAPWVAPEKGFPEGCPSVQTARSLGILSPAHGSPNGTPGRSIYVGTREVSEIRKDFPILGEKINGKDLVWLDNAATTQKPRQVIDRLNYFYEHENSNVHRGAHELAARSTDAYEEARGKTARFIGAPSADSIVFVRGTTEGINLVAQAYVKQYLTPGDEIILTVLEHHANIVPWQLIAQETGAVIRVAPIDKTGQIILSEYSRLFNHRTKFVAAAQVSNALGTVTPAAELIHIAHAQGVRVLIDGAQSVSHMPVNVTALDADFFVFSGHKIFGPTGIGVLYGKADVLEAARPYQGGGNMIADVTFERTLYQQPPNKFEAGTGNIADAVGLGAALDYVSAIGMENIGAYEHELVRYGMAELAKVPGLRLVGTAPGKASVLSFVLDGFGNEEVGKYLNTQGIAVRAGHHCAQPVLRSFGLEGTVRPSIAFYNTPGEIDALVHALHTLVRR